MRVNADLGILSEESRYFLFLLEQYALSKGITGREALDLFEEAGIVDYIYSMYYSYHVERTENAIADIDTVIQTGHSSRAPYSKVINSCREERY